jgi:hypothetical protein
MVVALVAPGCQTAKSSNPTSPSVAGPIPGVNITVPKILEPPPGAQIKAQDQPVTLMIENASTNGQRPITYTFEVAADTDFVNRVFVREGVEPGSNGRTSVRLPDALAADRTYYWRVKALDGANSSPYSGTVSFTIYTPVIIQAPQPLAPVGGTRTSSAQPEFSVRNAERSGPAGQIAYTFQIAENDTFTTMVAVVTVSEQPIQTKFTIAQTLKSDTRYFWRVRAYDPTTTSAWSATQTFLTPLAPTTPPPTPPPSGGWPTTGPDVVNYVQSRYPERLAAGVSADQRRANMEFLRDRMIEAGICGGMDLAWNLKRGGPERSVDFIAYRKNGTWIGVDIGYDYDNTSQPLRLQWAEAGPDLIFPDTYLPRPTCK